jgi:hypothetical protein
MVDPISSHKWWDTLCHPTSDKATLYHPTSDGGPCVIPTSDGGPCIIPQVMRELNVTQLMDRGTLHHPRCDMDISCYTQLIWKSYIIPQVMGTLHHPRCDMDISCYTQLIWKSYIIPQVMGTLYHPICDRDISCHSHLMWKSYIVLHIKIIQKLSPTYENSVSTISLACYGITFVLACGIL